MRIEAHAGSDLSGHLIDVLRAREGWDAAIGRLRERWRCGRPDAVRRAAAYAHLYEGRRGAMVVDVVASQQRKYEQRVRPLVRRWEQQHPGSSSLSDLATHPPDRDALGLRSGEVETMVTVAQNLTTFAAHHQANEDEACRLWAASVSGIEHAPTLDPYVGAVRGIGPALFAYTRMRCGADALKPDSRVRGALNSLGFNVPADQHATLVIARAAAAAIETDLLVLDQLLWWTDDV